MKNKIVILLCLVLVISISLFLIVRKGDTPSGNIQVVVDKNSGDMGDFNKYLIHFYSGDNSVNGRVIDSKGENYLDYIKEGLSDSLSDNHIYYTVFSSQVFNTAIEADNSYYFNKPLSAGIPEVFYTLGKTNNSYLYVPVTWSPWGIYYNKALFNDLGLKEPETIEELYALCDKLLENNVTPFSMVQKLQWPITAWFDYLDLRYNGADFHNRLLSGVESFTDERVKRVFMEIVRVIKAGYFHIDENQYDWKSMITTLAEGNTAMILGGAFYYENASAEVKDNMGWFPFPLSDKNDKYSEVVTTSGYIVNGEAEDLDTVKDFLLFSQSEKAQKTVVQYSDFYPVDSSALTLLKREDLNKAYTNIRGAEGLIPSFERNNDPFIHLQFKTALAMLFSMEGEEQVEVLLNKLESSRRYE